MLTITLKDVTKYWHKQPFSAKILDHLNISFCQPNKYVIYGLNGSGKSTFLKILVGLESVSSGQVIWQDNIHLNQSQNFSICAPWVEIIEELTGLEFLHFHFKLKPIKSGWTIGQILDTLNLTKYKDQKIKTYSSGMVQKLKWSQALFSEVSCIFLDEPLSNLDEVSQQILKDIFLKYCSQQLVILATNTTQELTWGAINYRLEEGLLSENFS